MRLRLLGAEDAKTTMGPPVRMYLSPIWGGHTDPCAQLYPPHPPLRLLWAWTCAWLTTQSHHVPTLPPFYLWVIPLQEGAWVGARSA